MVDSKTETFEIKAPRNVGQFIRSQREAFGISQRKLSLIFNPPVTTQFISNIERGVTPLPPTHVKVLADALRVPEARLLDLLRKDYEAKLNLRTGHACGSLDPVLVQVCDLFEKLDKHSKKGFEQKCIEFFGDLWTKSQE